MNYNSSFVRNTEVHLERGNKKIVLGNSREYTAICNQINLITYLFLKKGQRLFQRRFEKRGCSKILIIDPGEDPVHKAGLLNSGVPIMRRMWACWSEFRGGHADN